MYQKVMPDLWPSPIVSSYRNHVRLLKITLYREYNLILIFLFQTFVIYTKKTRQVRIGKKMTLQTWKKRNWAKREHKNCRDFHRFQLSFCGMVEIVQLYSTIGLNKLYFKNNASLVYYTAPNSFVPEKCWLTTWNYFCENEQGHGLEIIY